MHFNTCICIRRQENSVDYENVVRNQSNDMVNDSRPTENGNTTTSRPRDRGLQIDTITQNTRELNTTTHRPRERLYRQNRSTRSSYVEPRNWEPPGTDNNRGYYNHEDVLPPQGHRLVR